MDNTFTRQELIRYSRQILLPDLKEEGQHKLKTGSVLVIGAGGLGSPALLYLAAAGVGRIGIVDFDVVDESNLQRQILYTTHDIGVSKSAKASDRITQLNPNVSVITHNVLLTAENALEIISGYKVVIDGSDNLPTRYLVNDACVLAGKTLIYGAIFQFEGQVSVFNHLHEDGNRGPNYRDLFPQPPPPEMVPSCSAGGVLGVLPGIIGSMQASEAIKILANIGTSLSGRLMIFDALDFTTRFLNLRSSAGNPAITKLIDYHAFCNQHSSRLPTGEMEPLEVNDLLKKSVIQLIDVRERFEHDLVNIGGLNIPVTEIEESLDLIEKVRTVVVYCRSGQRSAQVMDKLFERGFTNVMSMKGGLLKWREDVDKGLVYY